jgi:predicted ribosome-associated RNA-binding protein Tma20
MHECFPHRQHTRWSDCASICTYVGLKEVVVTRKAGEAVLRGAPVFAPGVLAMSKHLVEGDTVAVSIAREVPGTVPSTTTYL